LAMMSERARWDLDKNSFESQSKTLFRLSVCYLITLNLKGIHPAGTYRRVSGRTVMRSDEFT
jgi:hypothetical protein